MQRKNSLGDFSYYDCKIGAKIFCKTIVVLVGEGNDNGKNDLVKLQELINAENSDLFDVLEYISYAQLRSVVLLG